MSARHSWNVSLSLHCDHGGALRYFVDCIEYDRRFNYEVQQGLDYKSSYNTMMIGIHGVIAANTWIEACMYMNEWYHQVLQFASQQSGISYDEFCRFFLLAGFKLNHREDRGVSYSPYGVWGTPKK